MTTIVFPVSIYLFIFDSSIGRQYRDLPCSGYAARQ